MLQSLHRAQPGDHASPDHHDGAGLHVHEAHGLEGHVPVLTGGPAGHHLVLVSHLVLRQALLHLVLHGRHHLSSQSVPAESLHVSLVHGAAEDGESLDKSGGQESSRGEEDGEVELGWILLKHGVQVLGWRHLVVAAGHVLPAHLTSLAGPPDDDVALAGDPDGHQAQDTGGQEVMEALHESLQGENYFNDHHVDFPQWSQ